MSEYVRTASARVASKPETAVPQGGQKLLVAGGVLAALGASSCCILPLVLFSVGVSGAWIGNLTALAPYQPVFVAAALVFLAVGFWRVYRQPKVACAEGSACARPGANRVAKIGLWLATALVFAAVAFPYAAPMLLDL